MPQLDNPDTFKAALVIIGNEILSGRTMDANTPWISERLTERGILLAEVRIIPDVERVIVETVKSLSAQYDYVFTTGGIGPTHDDITAAFEVIGRKSAFAGVHPAPGFGCAAR